MGSAIFASNIETYGTEVDFYNTLKEYITGLSTRITCETDVEDEFDKSISGNDHIATLSFKVDGASAFKLYRPDVLYSDGDYVGVRGITFGMDVDAGYGFSTKEMYIRPDDSGDPAYPKPFDECARGLLISHIVNDNLIYIRFTSVKSGEYRLAQTCMVLYTISNDSTYLSSSTATPLTFDKNHYFDLSNYTLYDKSNYATFGTFLSRFVHTAPAGTIDYIKSSIYQSSNEKRFENHAIYDSSTVITGSTVSLKDGAYLAVGPHQLVKIS